MHRTDRLIGRAYVLAVAALWLSACGSSGTNSPATTPSSESPTTPVAGTTTPSASASAPFPIPNGTYEATATRQEALAKGFSNKEIDAAYGQDGRLPVTFVFDDGTYQVFVTGDDGVKELGDKGTYSATTTRLVATDEAEGVAGQVYTYRWSFDGNVFSLKLLSDSGGQTDFRDVRLVSEHDYVKTG